MNYFKKVGKSFLYTIVTVLIGVFIITIFNYMNIFGIKAVNISKIIVIILAVFIGSFKLGIISNRKGYLEGLKYGLIIDAIFAMVNLIIYHNFKIRTIILYVIIVICSCLGSMLGITRNKEIQK
jgi:putative membrane protein (TIGR04086 family)